MRAAIPLVIVGNIGFMLVLARGLKGLLADYGYVGMALGTVAVIVGCFSLAMLADSRVKDMREMLDRIERKHRVNLWDERARLNR
ncbi:hypothetical protein [Amaricoccus solimangrovi]|uniref:Uncharacterized protein n=1 Tax=Amaricoccus solimangrovi TaxID=2589815 RepID=A0A501WXA3_9RHOB|nr:hypothetical protein [Amaricoccus solimangrovi]TPE53080.1 hypothetical protein FJM51_03390 [Amaricoccus solimangrovi]